MIIIVTDIQCQFYFLIVRFGNRVLEIQILDSYNRNVCATVKRVKIIDKTIDKDN